MRITPWTAAAAITFLGALAVATGAAAQNAQTAPSAGGQDVVQGPINATGDQAETLLQSLANLVKQSLPSDYQPNVGTAVPQDVKTQPMPPDAQAAIPDAADHHVAMTDDNTIMIVDPVTRQIVGLISGSDLDDTTGPGTTGSVPTDSGSGNTQ